MICGPHTKNDGSWWEEDSKGIPLARVCKKCKREKLARFKPEIISGYKQSDVDESIEE